MIRGGEKIESRERKGERNEKSETKSATERNDAVARVGIEILSSSSSNLATQPRAAPGKLDRPRGTRSPTTKDDSTAFAADFVLPEERKKKSPPSFLPGYNSHVPVSRPFDRRAASTHFFLFLLLLESCPGTSWHKTVIDSFLVQKATAEEREKGRGEAAGESKE